MGLTEGLVGRGGYDQERLTVELCHGTWIGTIIGAWDLRALCAQTSYDWGHGVIFKEVGASDVCARAIGWISARVLVSRGHEFGGIGMRT